MRRLRNCLRRLFGRRKALPATRFLMAGRQAYADYDIGAWTYGSPTVLAWKSGGRLRIGKYCSIADDVTILLGGEHDMRFVSTFPFGEFMAPGLGSAHEYSKGEVRIGHDVWIGRGATILSGVTIGDGAVIGAGAVVSKSVGPYEVWCGNPARRIRKRFPDHQIRRLLELRWWEWDDAVVRREAPFLMAADLDGFLARHAGERHSGDEPRDRCRVVAASDRAVRGANLAASPMFAEGSSQRPVSRLARAEFRPLKRSLQGPNGAPPTGIRDRTLEERRAETSEPTELIHSSTFGSTS